MLWRLSIFCDRRPFILMSYVILVRGGHHFKKNHVLGILRMNLDIGSFQQHGSRPICIWKLPIITRDPPRFAPLICVVVFIHTQYLSSRHLIKKAGVNLNQTRFLAIFISILDCNFLVSSMYPHEFSRLLSLLVLTTCSF